MALEVNEIGIRMRVKGDEEEEAGEQAVRKEKDENGGCGCLDRDEIVEECTRRVLQVLKSARER